MIKLRRPQRLDIIVGLLFLVLNIGDAAITLSALHRWPGVAYEVNPLMRYCIEQGDLFFWSVKVGIGLGISVLTSILVMPRRAFWFLMAGSAAVGIALISNIVHYLYALSTI